MASKSQKSDKPVNKPVGTRPGRNGGTLNSGGNWGGHRPPGHTPKTIIHELYASGNGDGLRAILNAQYQKALEGDPAAAKLILEHGFGKPGQSLTLQGDADKPLIVHHIPGFGDGK